jgi:hypothetical protein
MPRSQFKCWIPFNDITGRVISHLTVKQFWGWSPAHRAIFLCQCDCGTFVTRLGNSLLSREQDGRWEQSCGHVRRLKTVARNKAGKGINREPCGKTT